MNLSTEQSKKDSPRPASRDSPTWRNTGRTDSSIFLFFLSNGHARSPKSWTPREGRWETRTYSRPSVSRVGEPRCNSTFGIERLLLAIEGRDKSPPVPFASNNFNERIGSYPEVSPSIRRCARTVRWSSNRAGTCPGIVKTGNRRWNCYSMNEERGTPLARDCRNIENVVPPRLVSVSTTMQRQCPPCTLDLTR